METQNNNASVSIKRTLIFFAVSVCLILAFSQIDPIKNTINGVLDILSPVLVGVMLAYVINPVEVFFEKAALKLLPKRISDKTKGKLSRVIGITCSMVCLVLAVVLLLFLIIPEFLQSLMKLVDKAPALFDKGLEWVNTHFHPEGALMKNLGKYLDTAIDALTSWIGGEFSSAVTGILTSLVSVVSFMIDFFIAVIICVYALIEKNRLAAHMKKVLFAVFSPERANDVLVVARYGNEMFGKYISGKILTSTIVGILTFAFMSIVGIPYALLSASIVAVTNVIPYFGPFIGGIPTAMIILLTDVRQGVIYVIFLVVLQQLEGNIIEPLIMEDKTGLSKFWITVALLVCGGFFGVAGMIFSVPLFAVLFYCIKMAVDRSLKKKNMPVASDDYMNVHSYDIEKGVLTPNPAEKRRKKIKERISEWRAQKRASKSEEENNEN